MRGADINYMLGGTNILNTALSNIFSLQYIGFLHKFVLYKGLRGGLATISKTEIKIARRLEISIKKKPRLLLRYIQAVFHINCTVYRLCDYNNDVLQYIVHIVYFLWFPEISDS